MLWLSLNSASAFVDRCNNFSRGVWLCVYDCVYAHVCMRDWERENIYGGVNVELGCQNF